MYADDTTLISIAPTLPDLLTDTNYAASLATDWFHTNQLIVNGSKSNSIYIYIYTHQKPKSIPADLTISLTSTLNNRSKHIKLLPTILEEHLKFYEHVSHLTNCFVTQIKTLFTNKYFIYSIIKP